MERGEKYVSEEEVPLLRFSQSNDIVSPSVAAYCLDEDISVILPSCRLLYNTGIFAREVGELYSLSEFGEEYLANSSDFTGFLTPPETGSSGDDVDISTIINDLSYCQYTISIPPHNHYMESLFSATTRILSNKGEVEEESFSVAVERLSHIASLSTLQRMEEWINQLNTSLSFVLDDYEDCNIQKQDEELSSETWKETRQGLMGVFLIDNLLGFYTLLIECIKRACAERLVADFQRDNRKSLCRDCSEWVRDNLAQHQIEMLLEYFGSLSSNKRSAISSLRGFRNQLVHDVQDRYYGDLVEFGVSEMESGINLLREIQPELPEDSDSG